MTREHKLALIIGFSLVLLIGVLISDHFSRAAALDVAGFSEADSAAAPVVLPASREDLGPVVERPSQPPPAAPDSTALASADPGAADAPGGAAGWPDPAQFVKADNPPDPAASLVGDRERWRQLWETRQQAGEPPTSPEPSPAPAGPSPAQAAPQPAAPAPAGPAFADYTVKNGETLYQIAARHLGDGNRWRELRDANPKAVKPDGTVRAGVRLRIPLAPPGQAAIRDPLQAPKVRPGASPRPPSRPDGPRPPTYTVRPGDSLGEIAIRTLGTSRRAREIAALNGLKDADHVRVGMVLKIPRG